MKEYNDIETDCKANGTWMKNSDGSAFQGTPEQFVQQNSENFKRFFLMLLETSLVMFKKHIMVVKILLIILTQI